MYQSFVKDGTREFSNIISSYKYEYMKKTNLIKQKRTNEQGLKEVLIQRNQDIKKHEMDDDESEKFQENLSGITASNNNRLKQALKSLEADQKKTAYRERNSIKNKQKKEELDIDKINEITDFASEDQSILNINSNPNNNDTINNNSDNNFKKLNSGKIFNYNKTGSFNKINNNTKRVIINNDPENEYKLIKPINLNNSRLNKKNTNSNIYIDENCTINKSIGSFPLNPTNISNVEYKSDNNQTSRFRNCNPVRFSNITKSNFNNNSNRNQKEFLTKSGCKIY